MNATQTRHFRLYLLLGWLLAGGALALLAPVSPHNPVLGWSGVYWLLLAPALMLPFSLVSSAGNQPAPSRRCSMRRRNSRMISR